LAVPSPFLVVCIFSHLSVMLPPSLHNFLVPELNTHWGLQKT
jgi:hypothetical protein